jgi:sulfite exporter TauE/SafE
MLPAVVLGIAQGVRHSVEPDHLAAVSVMVKESRSMWRGAWLGAIWGIGHTASLLAMSIAVVGFGAVLPDSADRMFTLLVAAMLVLLGVRSLRSHPAHHAPRPARSALQALAIGMMHGLAGSSALTAMTFAALPTPSARLLYLSLFGLGSIAGMAAVSAAAGAWLQRIQRTWLLTTLGVVVAVASIAIGVMTALEAA